MRIRRRRRTAAARHHRGAGHARGDRRDSRSDGRRGLVALGTALVPYMHTTLGLVLANQIPLVGMIAQPFLCLLKCMELPESKQKTLGAAGRALVLERSNVNQMVQTFVRTIDNLSTG